MHKRHTDGLLIGDLADQARTSTDTIRYYERLGLLNATARSESRYRLYSDADLGRLLFIRRAKLLGLSLNEIRGLLGLAEEGACPPLRQQVAELLRQKIDECEVKLIELVSFKASLEERYQRALEQQDESDCNCSAFPASCSCLPVQLEELTTSTRESLPIVPKERNNDESHTHQKWRNDDGNHHARNPAQA